MASPVLTAPSITDLMQQELIESSNFMGSVEDGALPSAIMQAIKLGQQTEATNRAASILLTIDKIPGTDQTIGGISKSIEVYGWYIAGRLKSLAGAINQDEASAQVIVENLIVVCPDDSFVEPSIQNTFDGANVGNVSLTCLRNVGDTAKPNFQINLTNCRISFICQTVAVTTLAFIYDTIKMTYYPIGPDDKASGQVAAGFNLTTNAAIK